MDKEMQNRLEEAMLDLTRRERQIMEALPGSIEDVREHVYGTRDDVLVDNHKSLRNFMRRTRRKLEVHGLTISSGSKGYHKGYYRLATFEPRVEK